MKTALKILRDVVLLVSRITIGVILVTHGWHRWQTAGIAEQMQFLQNAGMPLPEIMAWLVIGFELVGGVLLLFGLGSNLIGFGMALMNILIILLARIDQSFLIQDQGWEYNAVLAVVGLLFMSYGGGRTGLDHLFLRPAEASEPLLADDAAEVRPQEF